MQRIGILNILLGFVIVFLSASAGSFLSLNVTDAFISDPDWLHSWNMTLLKSAHNHFNQFGFLIILFGLSLPYSRLDKKWKLMQSIGLWLGAIAMGPGMLIKASQAPSKDLDLVSGVIGLFLSLALLALGMHIVGLMKKIMRVG